MRVIEIKKSWIALSVVILVIMVALVINPKIYMDATMQGILVWATAVLPALFPFFFLTRILSELKLIDVLASKLEPVTRVLFNAPGVSSYVYLMSIISGYPVGAKLTSELYQAGVLNRGQVARICSFTSTSGPLFVIGSVGVGMFVSQAAGAIMLTAHLLGALLNGILYRNYKAREPQSTAITTAPPKDLGNLLGDSIYNSVISILIVGGYIALFFMFIEILTQFKILTLLQQGLAWIFQLIGVSPALATGAINGIVEVTHGCMDVAACAPENMRASVIIACGVISWGGFSTHFQAITFLSKCKINIGVYLVQKLTHCIISMALCWILLLIFGI